MKALILYDSFFGNTEQIARAVAGALGSPDEVSLCKVDALPPDALKGLTLLVVGSPTRAFRPSPSIKAFLDAIPAGSLQGVNVSAFDTRISAGDTDPGFLKVMIKLFGYAAGPMGKKLQNKGGNLVMPAEGFFVKASEGPLKDGEMERAAGWGRQIALKS